MNTAKQVAQYILVLSNPEIGAITSNLKLQKLLYFKKKPFISSIASQNREQRLKKASLVLLADYENDEELTIFTSIDSDPFYE
jgi:uncharacterized phage-associated protein